MKKLVNYTLIAFLLVFEVNSQEKPLSFLPITSNRNDVIKVLGNSKKQIGNIAIYDRENEVITITYYETGCLPSERKLNLSNGTVLEIKIVPKKQQPFDVATESLYEKYSLENGEKVYYNPKENIIIQTFNTKNVEYVAKQYFIPSDFQIDDCIIKQVSKDSPLAMLREKGKIFGNNQNNSLPTKVGGFFEKDSISFKHDALERFIEILNENLGSLGYIIISKGKTDSLSEISSRCKKICDFIKKKGISSERLIFIDGGITNTPGTHLVVDSKNHISLLGRDFKPIYICGK
jgi:hypothetical protein